MSLKRFVVMLPVISAPQDIIKIIMPWKININSFCNERNQMKNSVLWLETKLNIAIDLRKVLITSHKILSFQFLLMRNYCHSKKKSEDIFFWQSTYVKKINILTFVVQLCIYIFFILTFAGLLYRNTIIFLVWKLLNKYIHIIC